MMNPENKYVKYDCHSKLKIVLHKKHRAEADIAIPEDILTARQRARIDASSD